MYLLEVKKSLINVTTEWETTMMGILAGDTVYKGGLMYLA